MHHLRLQSLSGQQAQLSAAAPKSLGRHVCRYCGNAHRFCAQHATPTTRSSITTHLAHSRGQRPAHVPMLHAAVLPHGRTTLLPAHSRLLAGPGPARTAAPAGGRPRQRRLQPAGRQQKVAMQGISHPAADCVEAGLSVPELMQCQSQCCCLESTSSCHACLGSAHDVPLLLQ